MKPRIGVYLSEGMAARLAVAAQRPGATKSALVEAALDQFLGCGEDADDISVNRRLSLMSRQLEQLASDVRIVSETVALQARFQLAVTPPVSAAALRTACVRGSERFDELAAQVGRRVHLGTSLMRETMDRLGATERDPRGGDFGEGTPQADSRGHAPDLNVSTSVKSVSEHSAAVREDGSQTNFPEQTGIPLH